MDDRRTPVPLGLVAGINVVSAFNPVFFCVYAALLIFQRGAGVERQAMNVLLIAAVYTAPFLFTGVFAQFLNTRFSVRNVIVFTKAAEVLVALGGAAALARLDRFGMIPLLGVALLLGLEFSIYRPALKIYQAALLPRVDLSRAGAATESVTFGGIVAGTVFAVLALNFANRPAAVGILAALLAFLSLMLAMQLRPVLPVRRKLRIIELPRQWLQVFREQPRCRELVLTGIGECYVFSSIILTASMAIQYIGTILGAGGGELHLYSIMASPVVGAGLGCLLGGRLSGKNVEIGLVPPATLVMTLSALWIGLLPYLSDFYYESGLLAALLFVFGLSAGVTLVPMQAYQEYFVKRELAPAFFSWFYLPFGCGILAAIGLSFLMYYCDASIFSVTLALAVLTAGLAVVTFLLMPQFLLRMFMQILVRTLYRLRVFNAWRVPEEGGAVLVANRASFVDMLFLSMCTTRPIRFVMLERYYHIPVLHPLFRAVGFIEVPSNKPKQLRKFFEHTRELLRKGELLCVFPEDDITRNGTMSGFRDGLREMLPPELDLPILPVRIGMTWGSIFSCYYGKFKLRWPNELPHPATVTVGASMPRDISAYEIRIRLSELAAETELIPAPQERPFHAQFTRIAKHGKFKTAVGQYNGEKWERPANLSLLIRSILISRFLRRICDDSELYVGVMLPNSVAAFGCMVGVMMADRCPAILNYTAGAAANRHAAELAELKHILTSRAFLEKLQMEPLPGMVFLEDCVGDIGNPFGKLLWSAAALLLPASELIKLVSPGSWDDVHRTAALIFSSGSTGIPKGIMLSHHNINADVSAVTTMIAWGRGDRIIGNLPMFHSFGLTVCLWMPVVTGAETVLIANPLDAALATGALRAARVSVMASTPGFLQLYMRRGKAEDFQSLRLTISGAEKLRDDVAARYRRLTGLAIAEGYGCTELSPVVSINLANSRMELGVEIAERGSIGPPLPGVCIKIVDPSTFELMPENTDGLLIVKGAIVMQGYLRNPEKTAEVIRDGWYVTGDIAKMNRNGFITITGRLSRFSKIAGEMVPHELVEREINNILQPEDRLIAVCGVGDAKRGEKLVVLYTDPSRLAPESLIKLLREREIPNLWIPKAENFYVVDHLPLLGSGKLDLPSLNRIAAELAEDADESRGGV